LNAVGFLQKGMKKGVGPLGLNLSPLLRSCTSVYQLLPIYPCVMGGGGLQRVADAAKAGLLTEVVEARASAARAFHQEIQDAQATNAKSVEYTERGPTLIPVVGIEQPTAQTAEVVGGKLMLVNSYEGQDLGGDGTVPRVSGTPIELDNASREVYQAQMHGALQNADSTLANLKLLFKHLDCFILKIIGRSACSRRVHSGSISCVVNIAFAFIETRPTACTPSCGFLFKVD
jgi:hypothetical protein